MGLKFPFKTASFFKTVMGAQGFPKEPFPHVVLVGRSNVGKSSLINHLLGKKALARVSTTPGKTTTINLFLIDNRLFLVDLPGYGYAKRSKTDRNIWAKSVETYFSHFQDQITVCHLVDGRHNPTADDLAFQGWCEEIGKKPLSIYTKIDKIKKKKHSAPCLKKLQGGSHPHELGYSIKEGHYRETLIKTLNQMLSHDTT